MKPVFFPRASVPPRELYYTRGYSQMFDILFARRRGDAKKEGLS
jgi:hypothetical protein